MTNGTTTIEVPTEIRDKLREERTAHESNYGQTIERLLGDSHGQLWTEQEIRDIARAEVEQLTTRH